MEAGSSGYIPPRSWYLCEVRKARGHSPPQDPPHAGEHKRSRDRARRRQSRVTLPRLSRGRAHGGVANGRGPYVGRRRELDTESRGADISRARRRSGDSVALLFLYPPPHLGRPGPSFRTAPQSPLELPGRTHKGGVTAQPRGGYTLKWQIRKSPMKASKQRTKLR